jgi:aryl-alcohol dehydrogenase-like predicted oxidoreductase
VERLEKIRLGYSDLLVSRLCFGTEPFAIKKGPDGKKTQGDLTPIDGGKVLRDALDMGVNFWDTSDDYGTHPHVRQGLSMVNRQDVVIADKSYAMTYKEGEEAVKIALAELETEYVDLMLLHYVPYNTTKTPGQTYERGNLEKRMGALKAWCDAKKNGTVKAVGLTTHSTKVLRETLKVPEIEVVCTTLNKDGAVIEDGSLEEHIQAIKDAKKAGKGVYVIKLLNAGKLRDKAEDAIRFALQLHEHIDAWNIGMYDTSDVARNLKLLRNTLKH